MRLKQHVHIYIYIRDRDIDVNAAISTFDAPTGSNH